MVKKVTDKWKLKQIYQVKPPDIFGDKVMGETVGFEPRAIIGRVIEVGLDELTGDPAKAYTLLRFCIVDVKDKTAFTKFVGHYLPLSYIKALVRRRRTIVEDVLVVQTKDARLRIKPIVFCDAKISRSAQTSIRNTLRAELRKRIAELTLDQFVEELFLKDFTEKLLPALIKIAPIKKVEIRKTEVE